MPHVQLVTPDGAVYTEYKYWLTLDTGHRKLLSDTRVLCQLGTTNFTLILLEIESAQLYNSPTGFWVSDTTPIK